MSELIRQTWGSTPSATGQERPTRSAYDTQGDYLS